MTVIQDIAIAVEARRNCYRAGNETGYAHWTDVLDDLAANDLPSGSGIDRGTSIDLAHSTADKVILHTSFHHLNEVGYYTVWTHHAITVTPAFSGFSVQVGGINRNQIKDYLADTFRQALEREATS